MKIGLTAFTFIILLAACGSGDDKKADVVAEVPQQPINSKNPPVFNESFRKMINAYYDVKDALITADTVKANTAANLLAQSSDSLALGMLIDSTGVIKETASTFTGTIAGAAKGLAGETDIEKKRKEFQMISDAMYDLVRTVRYDEQTLYHHYCPMAFDNTGAYWLSKSNEVVNPYFGKKMLHCGELRDSLQFGK
jgi:Protein of unknown function (DUF3347)